MPAHPLQRGGVPVKERVRGKHHVRLRRRLRQPSPGWPVGAVVNHHPQGRGEPAQLLLPVAQNRRGADAQGGADAICLAPGNRLSAGLAAGSSPSAGAAPGSGPSRGPAPGIRPTAGPLVKEQGDEPNRLAQAHVVDQAGPTPTCSSHASQATPSSWYGRSCPASPGGWPTGARMASPGPVLLPGAPRSARATSRLSTSAAAPFPPA